MKIGLMGFDFDSPNKGCEALTYSFVNLILECFEEKLEVVNYSYGGLGEFPHKYPGITFAIRRPQIKNPLDWARIKREMSDLDIIFDVTFGDGFSDIYGRMWNFTTDMLKQLALCSGTPLILLPQTYGPYNNSILRKWASHIVNRCYAAYSRDIDSAAEMNIRCHDKVKVLTDMAFALPYDKTLYFVDTTRINVGINVSALLWDSEYAKDNKFGLKVDYHSFITEIISELTKNDNYIVHLIPHVIDNNNPCAAENDLRPCAEVKEIFADKENVICAPAFSNPIEAKSYIANMDVFTGARMHATIGAVSANVATIPFAYSKKFKTMFGNLKYCYVIEAREMETQMAINQTLTWIKNYDRLADASRLASKTTKEKLDSLKADICMLEHRTNGFLGS